MSRIQEMFEKSANHLLNQGMRSYSNSDNSCCYFIDTVNGDNEPITLMCAAAVFLDRYKLNYNENNSAFEDVKNKTLPEYENLTDKELELVNSLQFFHDTIDSADWLSRLYYLGEHYNLDTTFLKQREEL